MLKDHITKQEALDRIKAEWKPEPGVEEIPLEQACGRILAHDYCAEYSIPVVRASGMDGIAVNFDLLQDGIPDTSLWTEGKEYVRADTGDDFPDEYDTVLPVEWITFPEGGKAGITIEPKEMPGPGPEKSAVLKRGMNVRPAGSLIREGTMLAPAGTELTPLDIGELATGGHGTVSVIRKPKIAFIATGTELTAPGNELQRGQNFEANSFVAKAMLEIMGAEVSAAPAVEDDRTLLEATVQKAVDENDIVLISGGSSKGAEDFNWDIINRKGKQLFRWVKAAPGRPMSAAVIKGKLVVNLAGPKLGAYHGIEWCVKEAISLWYTGEYGNVAWGTPVKAALGADMPGIPLSAIVKMKVSDGIAVPVNGPCVKPGNALQDWETNAFYITDPSCAPPRKGDVIDLKLVRKAAQTKTSEPSALYAKSGRTSPGTGERDMPRKGAPKRGIGGWDNQADFYNKMAAMEKGFTLNQINCFDTDKTDTVLDIGCGPGRITVPMAGRAKSVTAADASPKMLEHCRNNAAEAGANNITTVLMDWEDADSVSRLEKHDIVIASRSIAMGDIEKLCSLAEKYVVLIMWSHGHPSIPMIINELFKGVDNEEMPKPPFTKDRSRGNNMLYNKIYDMGYNPNLRIVEDGFTKVYGSREEAYADLSGLKPVDSKLLHKRYDVFKKNADRFLTDNNDGTVTFLAPTKTVVVWWKPTKEE